MSLVFAGIVSHAPGITGRAKMADATTVQEFHSAFRRMGERRGIQYEEGQEDSEFHNKCESDRRAGIEDR